MEALIVCGRFPPDHAHHILALRQRLDAFEVPHDFKETCAQPEDAQRKLAARPAHMRDAMDRYPGKTIFFLESGCEIVGAKNDFARLADIEGDIAFCARTRCRLSGKPIFAPRTRAMLLRPTMKTHVLLGEWIEACAEAPAETSDRDALVMALERVPELSITLLGIEFCTTAQDSYPLPVIRYGRAEADVQKPWSLAGFAFRSLRS